MDLPIQEPVWISRLCESPSEVTALIKESANLSRVFFNEKHRNFESTEDFHNRLRQLHVFLPRDVTEFEEFFGRVDTFKNFNTGKKPELQVINTLWTFVLAAKIKSEFLAELTSIFDICRRLITRQHPRTEIFRAAALFLESYGYESEINVNEVIRFRMKALLPPSYSVFRA